VIKFENLHSTSLCHEPQFWWLDFLLLSSFVMIMFQRRQFSVCVH